MRPTLVVALSVLLAACGASSAVTTNGPLFPVDPRYAASAASSVAPRDPADELRAVHAGEAQLTEALAASDLVFLGTVVHVAPSPGIWCGVLATRQAVLYRVDKVLRGRAPAGEVVVRHLLVGPPMTDQDHPRLSAAIWREGARLLVAASVAPAPGSDLTPGGHGMLQLDATIDVVSADGDAATALTRLLR